MVLGLALLGVVAVVVAVIAAVLAALDSGQAPGSLLGEPSVTTLVGWLAAAAVGAVPSTVVLARTRNGQVRHVRSHAVVLDAARHLDEVSAVSPSASADGDDLTDVLEAMRLSALRLHSQLAQERAFSGQVAHQLRTPLTALGLQIEELTMHPETPRMVRADLQRARAEVDRLADIIADLLALARRGTLPSGRYETDPAVLAVHATHRWASTARAAGRALRLAGELPICQVPAPAGPASQVLDVLIDNAIKHGVGDIEVSVDVMADTVRLRVADQGTPATAALAPNSSAGEGIGLPVAEQLAAACGGRMVRAHHPSTAFDLMLPRQS
jgi:signal transduction histidine kinase